GRVGPARRGRAGGAAGARRGVAPPPAARGRGPGLFRQALAGQAPAGQVVATPIRIADPDAARLLSPGDVIDVLAAFEDGPFQARVIAQEVRVIARPPGRTDGGALLVLATTPGQAAQLAQAQAQGRLFVTIHPR
ncbi:flagellar biosynthesis protein FlgA, partial [Microbispora sp. NPDC049633]